MTFQDYSNHLSKSIFGEPIALDNWFRKNIKLFEKVKDRVTEFEEKIAKVDWENKEENLSTRRLKLRNDQRAQK